MQTKTALIFLAYFLITYCVFCWAEEDPTTEDDEAKLKKGAIIKAGCRHGYRLIRGLEKDKKPQNLPFLNKEI
ncbi:hypothetical protein QE152_g17121 [Popillia japonica]|uniref:Uncharacterized protein n=1 Tax=Popillia japonica TaxID=7064 RepID=A0AAW1L5D6_POPJA